MSPWQTPTPWACSTASSSWNPSHFFSTWDGHGGFGGDGDGSKHGEEAHLGEEGSGADPVVKAVLSELPDQEAGLVGEEGLGVGQAVEGWPQQPQQLGHARLVARHGQRGVVDDEHLNHHAAALRAAPRHLEEPGAAEAGLVLDGVLDVGDVVLHGEDLAGGEGHQLVAHPGHHLPGLRTALLHHQPSPHMLSTPEFLF